MKRKITKFNFNNTLLQERNKEEFKYKTNNRGIVITGYEGNKKDLVIPNKIENRVVNAIDDWAFDGYKLTKITLPSTIKNIGQGAFRDNRLTKVDIPKSVTFIGWRAFYDNQISSVVIPKSIKTISRNAFDNNVKIVKK